MIPIEVHNLTKRFGELTAVDNLDLEVKSGEFFGFLGPNGAGKTTTLQMLSGQLPPTDGTARILGIDAAIDPIAVKAAIGIVPELEYPPSFLSVEEYLHFVAAVRGLPDDGRVDTWIKFFGLEERRTTLCMSLSKGMKKKTTISAALLHEPKMLFMDEPFLDLDPIIQRKLKDWLTDFVKRGGTVFLSTHILELAEKLCTRVGIIDKGKLVAVGTLNELQSTAVSDRHVRSRAGENSAASGNGGSNNSSSGNGSSEDLEQIFVRLVSG